jgi:hypothetical protein
MYDDEFDLSDLAGPIPVVPSQLPGEIIFAVEHRRRNETKRWKDLNR